MKPKNRLAALCSTALVGAMTLATPVASADPQASTLPGGTSIEVEITSPPADALIAASAAQPITITGTAAVGEGVPNADSTLISVIDVSGSTTAPAGCGGNPNGDGASNTVLDCEITSLIALNQEAISSGVVDEVGVIAFGTSAGTGDSAPAPGSQQLVAPDADANTNGTADVEEVFASATTGSVNLFTPVAVGASTDFGAAVGAACALTQATSNSQVIVAFLSDGFGGGVSALPCAPKSATFQTFAVGAGANCAFGAFSLNTIATTTGGTCTNVTDPANLPDILPGIIASKLVSLDLEVDGVSVGAPSTVSLALPQDGPVNVTWSHDLNLAPGIHEICATANGTDYGGAGSVEDCHEVTVATLTLTPESEINDLTTETEHTVTAVVAAGVDGPVAGVDVDFTLGSGPNAPDSGSGATDANGEVTFTWTNPNQDPSGLGQDAVEACFTDDLGNDECDNATKDWRDLTPPTVACVPGVNPAGNTPPGASPQGVTKSHGFFELTATDVIDPDPEIYVRDSGSGHVFGPYADGTNIKWTQVGKKWSEEPMSGEVDWHLKGTGDAQVFAIDASGNNSGREVCSVPPTP